LSVGGQRQFLAPFAAAAGLPQNPDMTRQALAERIAAVSLLRGEFTLRSGRKSNFYLDKYRFETQPDILSELGKLLGEEARKAGVVRIAGPELGAVPLATAASLASGLPTVLVRNAKKDYGSAKQIEGVLEAGDAVLLVEDIVTSGGQLIEAFKALEAIGAKVLKAVAVIDRLEGGGEAIRAAGINYEPLFTTRDLGIA
jgi:orotate phosphoribosyltransferase